MNTKPIINFFSRLKELINTIKIKLLDEGAHLDKDNRLVRRGFYLFEIITVLTMVVCLFFLIKC